MKNNKSFIAAVVLGTAWAIVISMSFGAYLMHQYETGHTKQVQAEAQLLLKSVPVAQAASLAHSR